MTKHLVVAVALAIAALPCCAAGDETDQQIQDNLQHPCKQLNTPQWREVRAVTLTLDLIKQVNATDADIDALRQADPALGSQLAEIGLDTLGDTSFDQQVARYQSLPSVSAAIAKHGLTVRQYLADKLAFVMTMMVAMGVPSLYTVEQLQQQDCDVKNVKFFLAHNDEIGKLMQPP